jgi:glutamyl-tRNA synthetase
MTIRTRIAPSPTGTDIHIGNLYTALINWTVARQAKKKDPTAGQFVIRIEDTDRTRYVEGAEQQIIRSLADFGLTTDEDPQKGGPYGPYRQSERLELYQTYSRQLVQSGHAYYSFATKEQLEEMKAKSEELAKAEKQAFVAAAEAAESSGDAAPVDGSAPQKPKFDYMTAAKLHFRKMLRDPAVAAFTQEEFEAKVEEKYGPGALERGEVEYTIRLLVPDHTDITFTDLIRGEITINTDQIDDQVLLKSDGFPTYHLAVVVDDVAMKISHIIRAEEWIASTPKHVMLYEAFGWEKPVFCHVPILRNPDKSKLSKRKNPVWSHWYLDNGYLPEAVLNYLSLMGWSHPEQKEVFDLAEFVETFKLEDLSAVGPAFDPTKLEWMNGQWIRRISDDDLQQRLFRYLSTKHPGFKLRADYDQTGADDPAFRNNVTEQVDQYRPTQTQNESLEIKSSVFKATIPLVKERMRTLDDYLSLCRFLFVRPAEYEMDLAEFADVLPKVAERLEAIPDAEWKAEKIGEEMMALCGELEMKASKFFQMLRVVVTGKKVSPPLNESMELLGRGECVGRVRV